MKDKEKESEARWARIEKYNEEAAKWRNETEKLIAKMAADTDRLKAENDRRSAETSEWIAESRRRSAEIDREIAESRARSAERSAEVDREIAESRRQSAERSAEIDREIAESRRQSAEADRRMDEFCARMDEFCARIDKVCEQMGGINSNIGYHAEQFFQDTFAETLVFGGEKYDRIFKNFQGDGKVVGETEFDIVLINCKSVAVIEVKNRIHPKFVKQLAEERLAIFRNFFPEYRKHKVYLGIAGFSFSQKVREDAKKYGIGIIKQVGQSVEVDDVNLKAY